MITAPSFRDGSQRATACQTLLGLVGASECWKSTGPAPEARVAPNGDAGRDAQRILQACWAIWNGSSTLPLSELLQLEPRHLEAVGELISAMSRGASAIDAWLVRWEQLKAPPQPVLLEAPTVAPRRSRSA